MRILPRGRRDTDGSRRFLCVSLDGLGLATAGLLICSATFPAFVSGEPIADCPRSVAAYHGDAQRFVCRCGANPDHGYVFGTGVYTDDSMICGAALHEGVISVAGGSVVVEVLPGAERYEASSKNGVKSRAWKAWRRSFKVLASDTQPAAGGEIAGLQSVEDREGSDSRAREDRIREREERAARRNRESARASDDEGLDASDDSRSAAADIVVPASSKWAGLWEGDRWTANGTVEVSLFVGARSWVSIGSRCKGNLQPVRLGETAAEFNFEPAEVTVCKTPGRVTATAKASGGGRDQFGQLTAQIVLDTPSLNFNSLVAKEIPEIAEERFRFYVSDWRNRFVWTDARTPLLESVQAAQKDGMNCVSLASGRLTPQSETYSFGFNTNGNVVGHLMLLGCTGSCKGVTYSVRSTLNLYVDWLKEQYGTPAAFISSGSFMNRKYTIKWRLPVDYDTGEVPDREATVGVAVLSRDPTEYGAGC